MLKRVLGIILILLVFGLVVLTGVGIWLSRSSLPAFTQNGYVLSAQEGEVKQLAFSAEENYKFSRLGYVSFQDANGATAMVEQSSFLHLEGDGVSAFSDGVLLDFQDLSANFINNYYITAGVEIVAAGDEYTAQTSSGTLTFGDHLWKLSDARYMVRSSELTVHFSDTDERAVSGYVEVRVTEDGIVLLITEENQWSTISEECYLETASGVKVYPVTQIVDNGEYKMSLAKLAVSADDSIVLTEDETRRQIVPELNITAVDGVDGENGTDGEDGQAGTAGAEGETGEDGEQGMSGQGGTSGADGGKGADGNDALTATTVNSALPTMSITKWEVGATTLRGEITVKDEAQALDVSSSGTGTYAGTVTIYNEQTGEAVSCYFMESLNDDIWPDDSSSAAFPQFAAGQQQICFSTQLNALQPDTTYRLSVVAYYQMNEMIYSREFINRIFYTDSTGVILSKQIANTDSLTVQSSMAESYADSVAAVQVVLLTPQQNSGFSLASLDAPGSYTAKYVLNYTNGPTGQGTVTYYQGNNQETTSQLMNPVTDLKFSGLTSNTNYVARVYVETKAGLKTLTNQQLELQTLKTPPTWSTSDKPVANYNRATGAFEIYRPTVQDPDSGIREFVYTAYDQNDDAVRTQTVEPAKGEPLSFYLPTGDGYTYTFKVETVFYDNEKEVTYDLGMSDPVQSWGDKLPQIILTPSDGTPSQEYNKFAGDLTIQLTSPSSSLEVSNEHPLTLDFYADSLNSGALAFSISLDSAGTIVDVGPDGDLGTANYSLDGSNYPTVHLDLENLYNQTNYTIVLSGWLNLGDGKGEVYQTIGTTGFRTYAPINMSASWTIPQEGTSTAISRTLKLSAANTTEDKDREAYALQQLTSGSVRLELYSGTGVNKTRIAYTDITTEDRLAQLYGASGIEVTENTFGGSLSLSPSMDYTLVVSSITDATYSMNLGYQNVFESVANASLPITAQATPPDLLTNPAQGVKVTPIHNVDAPQYGAEYDENQPDDLLIGYKLESTYDNVQRLGYDVTYYAMEYSEFYNALLSGMDPIQNANKLMEVTQRISTSSDKVPAVAFLFGGDPGDEVLFTNNCHVYHTGDAVLNGTSLSGMGRGYRYVFAYTVRFSTTGNFQEDQLATYPYGHSEYTAYKAAYGAGIQFGKVIGQNMAYVLNSGMYEAPRMDPEIHTFVYSAASSLDPTGQYSEGSVTIHYTYKDVDGTIVDDGDPTEMTQISWTDPSGIVQSQSIKAKEATYVTDTGETAAGENWWQVTIPYKLSAEMGQPTTGMVEPKLLIDRYGIDYSDIMEALTENTAWENTGSDTFYLCHAPVDWAWGDAFENYASGLQIEANLADVASNIITFEVNNTLGSSAASTIAERLYAMELVFSYEENGKTTTTEPMYLPVSIAVNGRPYAELATGRIANLVGKEISFTARLLYDSGEQGWNLVDQEGPFALQMINGTGDNSTKFGFDHYFTAAAGGTSALPSGALSQQAGSSRLSLKSLYDSLADLDDPTKVFGNTAYLTNASSATLGRYYYIDHAGVDVSTNLDVELLTGRYVVPKGYATLENIQTVPGTFTLDSITPAIAIGTYRATTEKLVVSSNFSVDGASNADEIAGEDSNIRKVYMAVFPTQEDAEELNPDASVSFGYFEVEIDEKGTARPIDPESLELEGLEAGGTYWLAVYMEINGKTTVLMDAQTAQHAIYRFSAVKDVVVESAQGMVYYNTSYFEKYFKMNFAVSPYLGFETHYAIYATEDVTGQPLYTDEDLRENNLLTAPDVLTGVNCELNLNLEPSEKRSKLKPGGTYYMRVYVTEVGGADIVGEQTFPFTISPVGNTGALIYAQDADAESVTFQITLSDFQYSYMGRKQGASQTSEGALYAVRFTAVNSEGKEYCLLTKYDDQLYSGAGIQQNFVLNNEALAVEGGSVEGQSIDPATTYTIHVFAVPDYDHDGLVANDEGQTDGAKKDYNWYFNNDEGSNFQNLIDRIWDATGSYQEITGNKWIKEHFQIGQKSQKTTDGEGILINRDMATILRTDATTLQLNLAESYGIITDDDQGQSKQSFPLIKWSVVGQNVPFFPSGESRLSNGDTLFQRTTDAQGYSVYTFDIPTEIPSGSYQITIQLYRSEEGGASQEPYETLSIAYRG